MGLKCFLLERTTKVERHLRIYETGDCNPNNHSFHNAMYFLDRIEGTFNQEGHIESRDEDWDRNDTRFKVKCDHCNYYFTPLAVKQLFVESLYTDTRNGNLVTIKNSDPGAIWDAWWMSKHSDRSSNLWVGPEDRKALMCKLPDGCEWHIDGQASNCTMKNDHIHKCWCRHGTPPNLTVDKNGNTCAAGAGSILSSKGWHGFLRNGELVS